MSNHRLPETVDEAVEYLIAALDHETRTALQQMSREATISLHRDYGMSVRNTLGLWGSNLKLRADPEIAGLFPDDASDYIIKRMWDVLHSNQD